MKRKQYDVTIRPIHYACVSGGKDSLFMLGLILSSPDKYPLDCVVHYELEIDWPWCNAVIDEMEKRCSKIGIPFYRIKPSKTWNELYEKYDIPTRRCRWCNSDYKLNAEKQVIKWIESQSCRPIAYIGFCKDEEKRFKYQIGEWEKEAVCYPLAEEGYEESTILEWAKTQPIFNDWYKYFTRQGCMICPMLTRKELAYLYKYHPNKFEDWINKIEKYEQRFGKLFWEKPCREIEKRIKEKWVTVLDQEEAQQTLF